MQRVLHNVQDGRQSAVNMYDPLTRCPLDMYEKRQRHENLLKLQTALF